MNAKNVVTRSNHRELEILDQLGLAGGSCRIGFLSDRLQVSEQTVRRNISRLEKSGQVRKVHGGVQLIGAQNEPPFHQRMDENPQAKRRIAAAVADRIADGDSLFLDIGSTTAYVAKALQNHRELFIVTNSVAVAHALATRNNNRVFLAGGELRSHDGGAFGKSAIDFIHQFNLHYAVVSVGAVDAVSGFMLHDLQEAGVSREAVSRAQTTIVVADSEKFNRRAPINITEPEAFDLLITDRKPPADIAAMLNQHDIELVIAR